MVFHVSESLQKRFFKATRNSLGYTRRSFCPPENRSDGLVETDMSDNSKPEHSKLYLPLTAFQNLNDVSQQVLLEHPSPQLLSSPESLDTPSEGARFFATEPLFSLNMLVYIRASPLKPKFRFQELPRPVYR